MIINRMNCAQENECANYEAQVSLTARIRNAQVTDRTRSDRGQREG